MHDLPSPDRLFVLPDTVAVVTGATGNLGPLWICTLAAAGARVLGVDRPDPACEAGLAELAAALGPDRFLAARADVRDKEALHRALDSCTGRFGAPAVLVNNAGVDTPPGSAGRTYRTEDAPGEDFRLVLEVNVLGLFLCCQVFGGAMAGQGKGSIINIGSLYASVSPDPRLYEHLPADPPFLKPPAYGASKSAAANLTRYLAAHWGPRGVRVNTLSPGGVLGRQDPEFQRKFCARTPLGRMALPGDLAGPLLFLASEASAYVTGQELLVDGGFTAW